MTNPTHAPTSTRAERELEDLLLRIRGLMLVQRILQERGASAAEIEAHTNEADRLRARLTRVVARRVETKLAA